MISASSPRFGGLGSFIPAAELVAQLNSALCSAASEDLAAVSGGHSCTEAMHLLALTLLGLVGTKHVLHLLVLIWDFRIMRVPNYSTSAVPK